MLCHIGSGKRPESQRERWQMRNKKVNSVGAELPVLKLRYVVRRWKLIRVVS